MNNKDLELLRQEIDKVDKEILESLKTRFVLVKKIGEFKKQLGFGPVDKEREEELFVIYKSIGDDLGLDENLIKIIFKAIIEESKRIQNNN
ncbi:MAG TPA: hypothetical protein DEB09_03095 [Candidatus Magasanikbacteria bacterium]|nr:hypothetical protein [Candidatus Magasanikbacteria bacterium]